MSARSRRARSPVLPLAETRESRPSQPTGAILPRRAEGLYEASRACGLDAESLGQGLRQLGGVAEGPHPAVGHLHAALLHRLGRCRGAQPIGADIEVQQPAARHSGEGPPHGRTDVDIGGAVADPTAVEPGGEEIEAGQHPVAGGEALDSQAIPVGREDGVAHAHGSGAEVTGRGDIGQHQQRAGDHDRMRGEAVEEAGPVDQAGGGERGGQVQRGARSSVRPSSARAEPCEKVRMPGIVPNATGACRRPLPDAGGPGPHRGG